MATVYKLSATAVLESINQSTVRTPNLDPSIVSLIAENLGLTFTPEKETSEGTFAPIDILDYIYAVLHSPTYREKYKAKSQLTTRSISQTCPKWPGTSTSAVINLLKNG
jgi:hypothetical protein